jgi:AraC family transcriptional regulator, regulatory protein of adaptative response / DNA-3-methyladenine glycosylase II
MNVRTHKRVTAQNRQLDAAIECIFEPMSEIVGIRRDVLERARRSRDPRFDGKFFVAVLSTGIYCRPICPVRLSSAVHYYATAAAAAEAGFRPCLRCRPEAAPGSPAWIGTSAVVRRILRLINEGALDTGSVKDLATRIGMGSRHLNRLLVQQVGASPVAIAQTRRLHFAKRLLDETDLRATDIALAAGYGSVRRFNEAFKSTYKKSPMQLRKRHARGSQEASEITLKLSYRPPYDWKQAITFLSERAVLGLESVDASGYARYLRTATGHAFVRIDACKGEHALQMQVRGAPPAELFELSSRARRVFDLTADPAQIADVFMADALLAPLAGRRPGLRVIGVWEPFECAVRTLLERQVGRFAARAATADLVARAGEPIDGGLDGLTRLFPTASALAAADLSSLPLTPPQRETLRALSLAARDRIVCFSDSIEKITATLTKIPGLDDWVAQVVALRACGEPDAFPTQDLILRYQAADKTAPLSARALEERAQVWRPWRGYAACQLWAEAERISLSDELAIAARSPRARAIACSDS